MLRHAFKSVALLLLKLEDSVEDWHLAPICGHSQVHKLFMFYPTDIATLQAHQVNTISQLFDNHIIGGKTELFLFHY
jgi:hypothetical protein